MSHQIFIILITFICVLPAFSTDINAPSIIHIAQDLATSIDFIQLSMTTFIFGLFASQLIYGPLSDTIGRKKPLSIGILIFSIGSIIAASSHHIMTLILARLIQGLGAGSTACIWRALFIDRFESDEVVRYGSQLQLLLLFVIPIAPVIGGYLDEAFSWRASFTFMALFGTIGLGLVQMLPNASSTHPLPFTIRSIYTRYINLVKHPVFFKHIYCAASIYGSFFSWFIIGPVLTNLSPADFGIYNFYISLPSIFLSSQINKHFVKKIGSAQLINIGLCLMTIASMIIVISNLLSEPLILFAAYFFLMTGVMIALPNAFSGAFKPFEHTAGSAAGLYGSLQQFGAVVTGLILSFFPENTSYPFAAVVFFAAFSAYSLFYLLSEHTNASTIEKTIKK